jgi:hypothetical protein
MNENRRVLHASARLFGRQRSKHEHRIRQVCKALREGLRFLRSASITRRGNSHVSRLTVSALVVCAGVEAYSRAGAVPKEEDALDYHPHRPKKKK